MPWLMSGCRCGQSGGGSRWADDFGNFDIVASHANNAKSKNERFSPLLCDSLSSQRLNQTPSFPPNILTWDVNRAPQENKLSWDFCFAWQTNRVTTHNNNLAAVLADPL